MALRMNAKFLKFLKEVLQGLPIMEPNVKKGNRIRRRKLETKRVSCRSRFVLGCHAQSIRERERERNKTQSQFKNNNEIVHMHEHVTC